MPTRPTFMKKNSPRDNEVTIEQKYTGVCFRDILTQQGFFPRVSLPVIPGHEICDIFAFFYYNAPCFKASQAF